MKLLVDAQPSVLSVSKFNFNWGTFCFDLILNVLF